MLDRKHLPRSPEARLHLVGNQKRAALAAESGDPWEIVIRRDHHSAFALNGLDEDGGTLPAAVVFERVLGVKTLLFSFSTADEQLHALNEFFRLDRVEAGIDAWSELWRLLARADLRQPR